MEIIGLKINGDTVECPEGVTILEAADSAGIYIPRLCHHPDLPHAKDVILRECVYQGYMKIVSEKSGSTIGDNGHCNLCLVQIDGAEKPVNSCNIPVESGMDIRTETPELISLRKQALSKILATHPHACLTCAQREGCSRTDCSTNVPVEERCCILLGRCELGKISDYIGIPGDTPKYRPANLPVIKDDSLYDRDYNLCINCLRCVRVCGDVRKADVLGAVVKENRTWVGTLKKGHLKEAECRFCGACVEVCPTGALLDKENVPQIDKDGPLPCVGSCPAGIDIPHYLKFISEGRYREALEVIRASVPFPAILGYVCFHPCEDVCRRGSIDEAVAICSLKRFVADKIPIESLTTIEKKPDSGKKIAIVGSGPAGLTAAYYLSLTGHHVDIFDSNEKPGGMLRHGIPAYRLPDEVLDRELEILKDIGIGFKMKNRVGESFGIPELKSAGYDAILVAAGTSASKMINIENINLDGIFPALDFLKSARSGGKPELSGNVVVIGGGNVAIDAAMTALRLGAERVKLVCLESREEMPAHRWEIEQAEEEGIEIINSRGPDRFESDNDHVSQVEFKKCVRVFDERGRFDPRYDENDRNKIPADHVIVAIGQETEGDVIQFIKESQNNAGAFLQVDKDYATGVESVFAAGDVVCGPSSVIEAVAAGRKSAKAIDRYLGGNGIIEIAEAARAFDKPELGTDADVIQRPRQSGTVVAPEVRKKEFCLIEETLEENIAKLEAGRCLQCHLRQQLTTVILPPEKWQTFEKENVDAVPETGGVFQFLDANKKIIKISGTSNMRKSLLEKLENPGEARYFLWEEDPMYTKRESELIQQYLQEHGEMPGGGADDDLDDLF
ncbi:MAG: FAD-dependent oxidoreductase [Candidatus Zixiibacteriota bacterium]|nr:MAG: FAD-dependent oxidoreductase [candidate division Zixibacteria bacterium]